MIRSDIVTRAKSLGHHLGNWRVSTFGSRVTESATCVRCRLNVRIDSEKGISGGLLEVRCGESETESEESEAGSADEAEKEAVQATDEVEGAQGRDGDGA